MMYLRFLWSLLRHKYFVFIECCKLGVPWLGVVHDWSKFLPSEFMPYARYFYGNYPNRADILGDMRNIIPDRYTAEGVKAAFDVAWLHHQKRNRHHPQYWLLQYDNSTVWKAARIDWAEEACLVKDGEDIGVCDVPGRTSQNHAAIVEVVGLLNLCPSVLPMPDRYRREMLADWIGAGRAYLGNPDTCAWYLENRAKLILHPETRAWLEKELGL